MHVMSYAGETPKRIYMVGELPEGNVKARDKEVVAGAVPVGIEQVASLQIKNHGMRDTAFRVSTASSGIGMKYWFSKPICMVARDRSKHLSRCGCCCWRSATEQQSPAVMSFMRMMANGIVCMRFAEQADNRS